jgi:hypothetical protein
MNRTSYPSFYKHLGTEHTPLAAYQRGATITPFAGFVPVPKAERLARVRARKRQQEAELAAMETDELLMLLEASLALGANKDLL